MTINVPAGSGIVTSQRPDPAYIEHFPLQNFISWEVFIQNPNGALTFTSGTAQFYDGNGNPMLGSIPITQADFANAAVEFRPPGLTLPNCGDGVLDAGEPCDDGNTNNNDACNNACMIAVSVQADGAVIPINSNIGLPFPVQFIGHNIVPASVDMVLCFKEFEGPGGTCDDPLSYLGVRLIEYTSPPGDTYIYPLQTPDPNIGGTVFSGNGHEMGTSHRLAFNQRYAYDVTVRVGGDSCSPCDTNAGAYIYGEPILAMADGVVTVNAEGNPENSAPGVANINANVGVCPAERCDGTSPPCMTPGGFPGGGNMSCLGHNNGEFSFYAHMITGSNDLTDCDVDFLQGDQIGQVGNSGSSSGPHIHFHNMLNPNPDDPGSFSVPLYFTNIQFATAGYAPKRQLDTAVPTPTLLTILPFPAPIAQNAPSPAGAVAETEPNHMLAQHQALTFPATVTGVAEAADVGELAVRGDGIEDIFRVDFASPISLRINLSGFSASENLDVYVLTENFRVMNATNEGTTPVDGVPEQICITLQPGAYYILVSNVDSPERADTDYVLQLSNDAPQVTCSIINAVQPIPVNGDCEATVIVTMSATDDCCLDPVQATFDVQVSNPTGNATIGPVLQTDFDVHGPAELSAERRIVISDLTSCPATIEITVTATDCGGLVSQSCVDSVDVVDLVAPSITCPPPITLERGDKICNDDVRNWLDSATASDNCPGAITIENDADENSFNCGFPAGQTTPVEFTATDACGNVDTCTTEITIAPLHRTDTTQKGSLLAFSKVELKWDADGKLTQDTFLDFANDADAGGVDVQAYFINGDIALEEIALIDGTVVQEGEPGWNSVDCRFHLTKNQPHYWSAANGSSLCQSFTVLDPEGPGRPDAETGGRILRGYVVMWAVKFNPEGNYYEEIRWNHLKGDALIVNYAEGSAWEYNAWSAQARCNMQGEPPLDCTLFDVNGVCCEAEAIPGRLDLDGFQYDVTFDKLLLDYYGTGSQALSRTGAGPIDVSLDTDLTLHVMDIDLRQDGIGPVLTKAEFEVFNQNESKLSGLRRCICCWDQEWFSEYVRHAGIPNYFLRHLLGTDKGQARIDGMKSTECDYLETCGMEPIEPLFGVAGEMDENGTGYGYDGDFSRSAALLGLAMKHLTFEGATENVERAGMNLVGVGEQWAAPVERDPRLWVDNLISGKRGSTIMIDVVSGTGEARIAPRSAGREAAKAKATSDADRELKAKREANRLQNPGR